MESAIILASREPVKVLLRRRTGTESHFSKKCRVAEFWGVTNCRRSSANPAAVCGDECLFHSCDPNSIHNSSPQLSGVGIHACTSNVAGLLLMAPIFMVRL